jgi:hypothetical protein
VKFWMEDLDDIEHKHETNGIFVNFDKVID